MISQFVLALQTPDASGSLIQSIALFGLIFVIFYFMIIRPQSKRQKDRQKMLDALKKGDKIVTGGGIHGTIVGIDEKTLLVQIADNVKVKVERGSVSVGAKEAEAGEKK